ncbi:ABC transporter permease [Bradyrhizobium sp. KBS0727]|uniref:ABC transporter permease n=1 Tax=unclassified Bradyrhizobium TaxID=2631580 RepID=UPI00110E55D7|nr:MULTISPECIES: ABC transporter permease [unclassified Bradyrhizobium]QDW36877.1 ABC transporter permease [Bradyrhizobium sp. KBS0725]QDW43477.1 ABC transporter permease [Bradyrhizobium sp. KBS0727]
MSFIVRYPRLVAGLVIIASIVLSAAGAPFVFPFSPWEMRGAPFLPPGSPDFLLGTDALGRDVAAGIAHGALVSLLIGGVSTVVALGIGIGLGGTAGYVGNRIDDAIMRFTEFFQTIPSFLFAILLVAIFNPSILSIIVAIALVSWPPIARVVRAEFMTLRQREFVQAADVLGVSHLRIMFQTLLPNALPPVIVLASLMVANAILAESALSFLGLGDANWMSWGFMVGAGRSVIRIGWWVSVLPGLAIFVTVLGLNLVGEGLQILLNPRLAGSDRP